MVVKTKKCVNIRQKVIFQKDILLKLLCPVLILAVSSWKEDISPMAHNPGLCAVCLRSLSYRVS